MDSLINIGSIALIFFILLLAMIFLVNLINKKFIKSLKFLIIAIAIYFIGALLVLGGIKYNSVGNSSLIKNISENEILVAVYPFLYNNQYVKKDIEEDSESEFAAGPGFWNSNNSSSISGDNQGDDLGDGGDGCGAGAGGGDGGGGE